MTHKNYPEFIRDLMNNRFDRVERDDRLLDIFPNENREKGIELWERWDDDSVTIARLHLPLTKEPLYFSIPRSELEMLLSTHSKASLDKYPLVHG